MLKHPAALAAFLFLLSQVVLGQNAEAIYLQNPRPHNVYVQFKLQINSEDLVLNKSYFIAEIKDSVAVNRLKFYISYVSETSLDESFVVTKPSHWLIDAEDLESLERKFSVFSEQNINRIQFNIGIDSAAQMAGAQGGELDPTNGMYWSWQSGYINFKLEGTALSCPARNNTFQFHIGGYQAPFNTLQTVTLNVEDSDSLRIEIDLNQLMTKENLTENYQVMSPNRKAMNFAKNLPNIFYANP